MWAITNFYFYLLGLTIQQAAVEMINNAREYLEIEMGAKNIVWSNQPRVSQNADGDNVLQNRVTDSELSSQQSSNTQNYRKRKMDDAISPEHSKKRRGISSQLSEHFTCVRINSAESLSSQVSTVQPIKELNIINVFGSLEFFNQFKARITTSCTIGVSIGVNQLLKTPVIGNALLSQVDGENMDSYNCAFDDNKFVAGISLCLCDSTVYYLNFQNESSDDDAINFDMKIKFLNDFFHMDQLKLVMYDAKEQCKVLVKCFPQLRTLSTQLRDPLVANWIIQPDVERNLLTMVSLMNSMNQTLNNKLSPYIRFDNMHHIVPISLKLLELRTGGKALA